MKNLRKLISAFLAGAMLAAAVPANAEETAVKYAADANLQASLWGVAWNANADNTPWDKNSDYAAVSLEDAADGQSSLCVNIDSKKESNRYISVSSSLVSKLEKDKSYRLSFWYKGTLQAAKFASALTGGFGGWANRSNAYTSGETKNGWTELYRDFKAEQAGENLLLAFEYTGTNVLLDKFSLKETSTGEDNSVIVSGTELLKDGSFENWYPQNVSERKASEGWGVSYINQSEVELDAENHYTTAVSEYARTGENAMYIHFGTGYQSNRYMTLANSNKIKLAQGEYTLEFWGKGSLKEADALRAGVFWKDTFDISTVATAETDNAGWTRYVRHISVAANDNAEYTMQFLAQKQGYMLIDDVKLYNNETPDTNMLANGGFEESFDYIHAENKFETSNWVIEQVGIKTGWGDTNFIEASDKEAHTGTFSAHIANPLTTETGGVYTRIKQNMTIGAGTYNISFYAKGSFKPANVKVDLDFKGSANTRLNNTDKVSVSDAENGWKKYSMTFTLDQQAGCMQILFLCRTYDMYIDDIVMTKEGSSENMLKNAGFESSKIIDNTSIINPICYSVQQGGVLNITWKNPNNENIDGIKLYLDGVEIEGLSVDTAASAFNEIAVENLVNEREYTIKIAETIAGVEYSAELKGVPRDTSASNEIKLIGNQPTSSWRVFKNDVYSDETKRISNFITSIDYEDKAEGNSSYRMDANIPVKTSNRFPGIIQEIKGLERNTKYVMTFKYKTEGVQRFAVIEKTDLKTAEGASRNFFYQTLVPLMDGEGWQEYRLELTPKSDLNNNTDYLPYDPDADDGDLYNVNLYLISDQMLGSLWIDDVKVCSITSDGDMGENILKEGNFEYDAYTIAAPEYRLVLAEDEKQKITKLQAGEIEVSAEISNISAGDNFTAAYIVALYNGNTLVKVQAAETVIPQNPSGLPAPEYIAKVTVPENYENYKIKVMYWNSLNGMKSLGSSSELTKDGIK